MRIQTLVSGAPGVAELAAAAQEIKKNVTGVQENVSNIRELDRLFAQIKREKGRLGFVFANEA